MLGLGVTSGLVASPASATEGPAPGSTTRTVIADVHTDAISTWFENGSIVLDSKADVPATGTRYANDDVWFHVDNDSRNDSWPAGAPSFVAPTGSTVWMAPMVQAPNQIWPGFSTEAISTGVLKNNDISLSLQGVAGPGDVEVWTTGSFGAATRLWSSDENFKSFTRKNNVHMHANWAFTQPGIYELTVRADGVVAATDQPTSDTAVYTFVVGDLPETVLTSTTVEASATEVATGAPVTLTAAVSPAAVEDIAGAVEFLDGDTVLGHDPLDETGAAELEVSSFAVGTRSVTARFVPETTNLASASTSQPLIITVTDDSGVPFGINGVEASYEPGEVMRARVAGVTVGAGQEIQWRLRPAGTDHTGTVLSRFVPEANNPEARAGRLDLRMDASYDGYQLQAALMHGEQTLATTGWTGPISVSDAVQPLSLTYDGPTPFRPGDTAGLIASGRELAAGESLRIVLNPSLGHFNLWTLPSSGFHATGDRMFAFEPPGNSLSPLALQVVRDGLVVAQSEPLAVDFQPFEFFFEGVQPLYRAGQTFSATMTVIPDLGDRVTYSWAMYDDYENPMKVAQGEEGRTFEMPVTADMNGKRMFIQARVAYASGNTALVGGAYPYLTVTDQAGQLFLFSSLSDHYHQNSPVHLQLSADPALVDGDTVAWEWRWPGTDWEPLPGAEDLTHRLTAEQAMDGLEVRATLTFADRELEPIVAGPVVIDVDDHGFPAVQVPTVGGKIDYVAGEGLALTRELPTNVATILTQHRWERKAAGSEEWTMLEGQSGEDLALPATLADDGASYRVSILKPNGDVAYGPSSAVTISVGPEAATELAIAGVEESYQPGEVLRARVVGRALESGQTWRWVIRPLGATSSGYIFYGDGDPGEVSQGRLRQLLGAEHDGYEIRARLRQGSSYVVGVDTAWVPINVENAVEPITTTFPAGEFYLGDTVELPLSRPLAAGESVRLVSRFMSPWSVEEGTRVDDQTMSWRPTYSVYDDSDLALQVVRNGVVVATSEPFHGTVADREVLVEGMRSVYRVGQTMSLTAEVHPPKEGLVYQWSTYEFDPLTFEFSFPVIKEGTGPEALSVDVPMTMEWNDKPIIFWARDRSGDEEVIVGAWSDTVTVSDAAPDEQLLFLEELSGHYHQGNTINLELVADPALSEGDSLAWEWKWPGDGNAWTSFPGASGTSRQLTAEQALDGVQVRATVDFAAEGQEPMTTEPVTIHVDDHGASARQLPTVAGELSVTEGETVTLTRVLPENGPTILTEHAWEKKVGDGDWAVIGGESGAEISFPAALVDDGAQYRVAILKPDGAVAYGPSPAVTLEVKATPPVENTAPPVVTGAPVMGQTLSATSGAWSPEPDSLAYQWLADGAPIAGATENRLLLTAARLGQAISVEVRATKVGHVDGVTVSATTSPVTRPQPGPEPGPEPEPKPEPEPEPTSMSAPDVRQVYGKAAQLAVTVSPRASGQILVRVGSQTLTGQLDEGRATLTLPARTLEPGTRQVQLYYPGVEGEFTSSTGTATVQVAKATSTVRLRVLTKTVKLGNKARVKVVVGADGVAPSGLVVVKIAGQKQVMELNRRGEAVAKIVIAGSTSLGVKTMRVAYRGDAHVTGDRRTTARVRVTR